jgi:hypothetical protein
MTNSELYLAAVGVISAVLSGAGAWWSAKSAHRAQQSAEEAGAQNTLLTVVQIAKDCERTASQIRRLAGDLVGAARMSQVRRGVSQDSATEIVLQIEKTLSLQASALCQGLPNYLPPKVEALVNRNDSLQSALIELTVKQVDLHRIRDELQSHLDKVQGVKT